MNLMNLIRLIAVATLLWLLYRLILALLEKGKGAKVRKRPHREGHTMVRCAGCGLHVPQNEAFERGGKFYCSKEHMERADSWKRDE